MWDGDGSCEHKWAGFVRKGISGGKESRKVQIKGQENFQIVGDSNQAFCEKCGAWRGSLGLEPTPELYVQHLVQVFREVRRISRKDSQCFINISDTRSKNREWVGIPWRLVFALQGDGWRWEDEIIWNKLNPMPGSQKNRCTRSHEIVLQMDKSQDAYFDQDAIRERYTEPLDRWGGNMVRGDYNTKTDQYAMIERAGRNMRPNPSGRNKRTVWTIATQPFPEAHFAVFPEKLVEPCILAGTSAKGCCPECGAPWERIVENTYKKHWKGGYIGKKKNDNITPMAGMPRLSKESKTLYWQPTCKCLIEGMTDFIGEDPNDPNRICTMFPPDPVPCIVLDPFLGAGTSALVAKKLGRDFIGIELSEEYVEMANRRISQVVARLPNL